MSTYTATTSFADIDATTPSGSEDAAKIDDAIREIKLVAKTVNAKAHSVIGEMRCAVWHDVFTGSSYPTVGLINTWTPRSGWQRISDVTSIDQSASGGVFKPIAGTYLLFAHAPGYGINRHQIRVADVTVVPTAVAGLYGSVSYAATNVNVNSVNAETQSVIAGVLTTDGTKQFRIEHIFAKTDTSGWGISNPFGGENVYANLVLLKIG